ncbi:MAG: peptide chain release factor 3, partial [Lachnospiraceae bacterium]|nr:peptide chain release factor 3 [Lachnospiraceae bacterium]
YDRTTQEITKFFAKDSGQHELETERVPIEEAEGVIGQAAYEKLQEDLELLDGAAEEFDLDKVSKGLQSPVFFGSALTNFGVENFLNHFLKMTYSPLPRMSTKGEISPFDETFSAFVFKIQANMNKAHRDRIAFMRIVSGKFEAGMEVWHVQGERNIRLTQPQQMMAEERKIVEEAYAGDIIGIFDPGIFHIGDTIETGNEKFRYSGIPTFAPDHFARVRQLDTMKRKQFTKGMYQIALEGAVQIFKEVNSGMEEIIVGAVGVLQFDVLKFRLQSEYHVEIGLEQLPYEYIRWIENPHEIDVSAIQGTSDMRVITDLNDQPLLLFINPWSVRMVEERNPKLQLSEFGNVEEF